MDAHDDIYRELRRLAGGYLRHERARSVQATELVHDAWMRLMQTPNAPWTDRATFMAFASIAMRRLLVERARARRAQKRGGDPVRVSLDEQSATVETRSIDCLAVDEALHTLARVDPDLARLVELRYFGGLTVEETAEALGVSPATVKRQWALARAWLLRALASGDPAS